MIELAEVRETIDAPADAIWALLMDFGHPQRLAPTIDRCTVTGDGVGAIRIVESSRGPVIHEKLLECDAARHLFRYAILDSGDMPFAHVQSYECTVLLTARSPTRTEIGWRSEGIVDGPLEPINAFLVALYRSASAQIERHIAAAAG